MKNVEKDIKKSLILSIVLTIMFVIGIPLIIFYAGKNWIIMTIGIIFVVLGFYGSPISWVAYAGKKKTGRIVECVLKENLYSNSEISNHLQLNEKEIHSEITKAITKKYLIGFKYDGKNLSINKNIQQTPIIQTKQCPNCGGNLEQYDNFWLCPYCGVKCSDSNKFNDK